jgi:hypothetical protein
MISIRYQSMMKPFPTSPPPPANKEVENAIYKIKNGTAAGITGESSDILKNLLTEVIHFIDDINSHNWTDQYHCPEWYDMALKVLYT